MKLERNLQTTNKTKTKTKTNLTYKYYDVSFLLI